MRWAEEALGMGRIMKFGIDRLGNRNLRMELDCPNCGSARIGFSSGNGKGWIDDMACPKCGTRVILDGVNITAIRENDPVEANGETETQSAVSIA